MESNSDRLMIENTIIIQADPMVQDSWDSARKITCDWQSKLEKEGYAVLKGVLTMSEVDTARWDHP